MWPSVAVFSRGRAVWSPWETETVEPAFGTYHFIQGEVVTDSTIKRLFFPLGFVWTLKLRFILDIHMIKTIILSYIQWMDTFFQTWDSGSIRNGGTEVRDGKIFLSSQVSDKLRFVCVCFQKCSFDRPFSSFTSGDHRSGEWECFQVSSFRIAGKKMCRRLSGLNQRKC